MRLESNHRPNFGDRELEQQIVTSLRRHHVPSLRNVTVQASQGQVVLRGEVTSFYAKQLSQHSARRLAGDNHVIDEVSVVTPATLRDPVRLRQTAAAGVALLMLVLVSGCSQQSAAPPVPVHPVTGQVTFNGKPAVGAAVVFHAKAADGQFPAPRAYTDSQGNYALSTFNGQDGAPAGEYAVTVELRAPVLKDGELVAGPNVIPQPYGSPKTTKLQVRVAEGSNTVPLKIIR